MSKLRDRIWDTARRKSGGLGFAVSAATASTVARVLVLAEVADAGEASAAVETGAGALLCTAAPSAIGAVVDAAGGAPVGCRLQQATVEDAATLAAAGADFFAFDAAGTPAEALLDRTLGHVLLLADGASEEDLRLFAPLDLDAVIVAEPAVPVTVRQQLELRRIADLIRNPLIVPTATALSTSALEVRRDAGAPVTLVMRAAADALPSIVEAAMAVRPPRERGEERATPLVPSVAGMMEPEEEEEEFGLP